MPKILLTAFGPYGDFPDNAGWLSLVELTREYPRLQNVTTRRYPVDFNETRLQLEKDLETEYDFILHLGQAVGAHTIELERIALNVGRDHGCPTDDFFELVPDGPVAYQSTLPLTEWCLDIRNAGIPCNVSHHAGTYICNALFYWTSHLIASNRWDCQVAFVHLPLSPQQEGATQGNHPTLPTSMAAHAVSIMLQSLLGPQHV